MYVKTLELKNFRNYQSLSCVFDRKTNVLYGDNAQGKTNILEAISVLATTRSHKGARDSEMIRFGEEEAHLRMFFERGNIEHKIDIHLKKNGRKGVAIDGVPVKRAADLFGMINIVFFSPEDLNIIKNGPRERRRFLDSQLSQLDRIYISNLAKYNKILVQRNALLKEIPYRRELIDTLDIWDAQMVSCGIPLIRARRTFTEQLGNVVREIHANLTSGKENLTVLYEPDVSESDFASTLGKMRDRDLKMRTSTVGPHRDDFLVDADGIDIRRFGSQGQQRSAALSLKLSEINLVEKIIGDTPVLLLDDVLSELDSSRQKTLLGNMHEVQTFITCTGMDDLIRNQFPVSMAFHVVNGTIQRQEQR